MICGVYSAKRRDAAGTLSNHVRTIARNAKGNAPACRDIRCLCSLLNVGLILRVGGTSRDVHSSTLRQASGNHSASYQGSSRCEDSKKE